MNSQARTHVAKAEAYIAKGDEFYGLAADEMIAARAADPALSWKALAAEFGHTDRWARDIVAWRTNAVCTPTPFSEPKGAVASRHAKSVLTDAPLEQVEQIIDSLPKERQQAIAAAAKDAWMGARQERDERIARRTPEEVKEAEEANRNMDEMTRRMGGVFSSNLVISDLMGATEQLHEMIEEGELSPEVMKMIDDAHDQFVRELDFAKSLMGN